MLAAQNCCISSQHFKMVNKVNKQVLFNIIWEQPHRNPSRQRMESSATCATICAVPTADESNHSATSMLHPHHADIHSTTAYTALA